MSYRGVFELFLKLNVLACSDDEIKHCAQKNITGLPDDLALDRDGWLEMLMSYVIEPCLARLNMPLFIYDVDGYNVADRFELYINGIELANGYNELLDADELRQRFEQDNKRRVEQNKSVIPVDEHLLSAMKAGLPECAGVALGLDRLIMIELAKTSLADVTSFSFNRA
jgi:lysyl-tRNA synthetase class 2